jgi:hypothetical protein
MLLLSKRPRRSTRGVDCGPIRVDRSYLAIRNEGVPERFRVLLARLEAEEAGAAAAAPTADATALPLVRRKAR